MKLPKLASAMPFAHYLGLARAEEPSDDERKQRDGESDDDYAKRMEEMDEEEESARKAEEERKEEDARKAEEEKRKEEDAKKAKRAEDENDVDGDDADMEDDEEDEKRAGRAKSARQRERVRCARIVAEGIKLGRVKQACVFAFDSTLTSASAVAALNAANLDAPVQSASRRPSIDERMSRVVTPNPGANSGRAPSADPSKNLADRIVAAGERIVRK